MTFKDVILKNFQGSIKKYLGYFMSCSFSIMLFFMYSTLIFNKELKGREDAEALSYIFPITMVAIAFFSVFFINYAHSAFIKGRNKEFGVYTSLGVSREELQKLINLENILISSAALAAGIGVGALCSRLFQMVILSLLEIKNIYFSLNYQPFLLTALVFAAIFIAVMAGTSLRMRKMDISGFLKEARKSEGREYGRKDLILGSLGLLLMAASVVCLVIIANDESLNSKPVVLIAYMIIAFFGVYQVLSHGGNLILHLVKKSKYYYRNMLSVMELHHRFSQNRRIIFVLSVLSTVTIFLVASPFSLLSLSATIAEMDKNHLEYVETAGENHLPEGTLEDILKDQEVIRSNRLKFLYLNTVEGSAQLSDCKPVVSATEYNSLTGSDLLIQAGEAMNIVISWKPGNHGINPGSTYELYEGNHSYRFRFIDSRRGEWIAGSAAFPADAVVVISDGDYRMIMSSVTEQNIGYYHMIDFQNWKNSKGAVEALKEKLSGSRLKIISVIDTYESLKSGYSVFLFVSTVMGILFFVAGGSVLYFKQFTELAETKATFRKLYKIGITDIEMKNTIGKELSVVFFLPLIFGSFLGVSLIYLMTYIVGGDAIIREFLTNACVVVAVYFLSQGIFFWITRRKYVIEIVKG